MVHSGIYYKPGSLKLEIVLMEENNLLNLQKNNVKFECGKLIVQITPRKSV